MTNIIYHNPFSYLPVKQWWLRPFAWMARCQNVDIYYQLYGRDTNAEGLDLRVRFDRKGNPVIAHGLIEYTGDIQRELYTSNGVVVRVLLETTPFMTRYQRARQKGLFWGFCDRLKDKYPDITFYGGWPRDEWRCKVYNFGIRDPEVTEMHGSVSGNKLNCLRLKSWARKHNHEIIENAKTEYVMIDYVEFQ